MSDVKVYASALSLFEVKRKLLKECAKKDFIERCIELMITSSIIIEVDEQVSLAAADYAEKFKLPAADAIIYTTALLHACTLITFDNDFRNLENVKVLK